MYIYVGFKWMWGVLYIYHYILYITLYTCIIDHMIYIMYIIVYYVSVLYRLTQKHLFQNTDFMLQLIGALELRACTPSKPPAADSDSDLDNSENEEDIDCPEVGRGEGNNIDPEADGNAGGESVVVKKRKKPVYSYGAKPFIPFAGHLIQLAKVSVWIYIYIYMCVYI